MRSRAASHPTPGGGAERREGSDGSHGWCWADRVSGWEQAKLGGKGCGSSRQSRAPTLIQLSISECPLTPSPLGRQRLFIDPHDVVEGFSAPTGAMRDLQQPKAPPSRRAVGFCLRQALESCACWLACGCNQGLEHMSYDSQACPRQAARVFSGTIWNRQMRRTWAGGSRQRRARLQGTAAMRTM